MIVQLERQNDGSRKVTSVQEIQGMEGDVILLQEVFKFHPHLSRDGRQIGELDSTGLRPKFAEKLALHGIELPAKVFQRSARTPAVKIGTTSRTGMLARGRRR